jgi:hypothetical protein
MLLTLMTGSRFVATHYVTNGETDIGFVHYMAYIMIKASSVISVLFTLHSDCSVMRQKILADYIKWKSCNLNVTSNIVMVQ